MTDLSTSRFPRLLVGVIWILGLVLAVACAVMYLVARSWTLARPSLLEQAAFGLQIVAEVGFLSAGGVIISKRPRHLLGWAMLAGGFAALAAGTAHRYARLGIRFDSYSTPYEEAVSVPARMWAGWFGSWTGVMAAAVLLLFVPMMFPSGRLPSRWWRPAAWYCAAATAAHAARVAFAPGPLAAVPTVERPLNPFGAEWARWLQRRVSLFGRSPWLPENSWQVTSLGLIAGIVLAATVVGARYIRTPKSERTPVRWFALSALMVGAAYTVALGRFAAGIHSDSIDQVLTMVLSVGYLGMAVGTLVAIFRHRLFELDVVVRRTAAFGGLSVFIALVYTATALSAGSFARGSASAGWMVSVFGTAVAAAGLEPVRQRAERIATRLVYGERLAPFELAMQLSRRLAEVPPPEAPAELARQVGRGVGAQQVTVRFGTDGPPVAAWPSGGEGVASAHGDSETVVAEFRGDAVAELKWTRFPGDPITPADRDLMMALVEQAAPALHSASVVAELGRRADEAAQRSAELAASRSRLAAAQLEAQTQFQVDLQDVVSRGLDGLADELRTIDSKDTPEVALGTVKATAEDALRRLRRLGRGLYPNLLEGRGLVSALRGLAEETPATVDMMFDLDTRAEAAVELALFFTCADLVRGLDAVDHVTIRLEESRADITCTVTVPRLAASVRQAVEDRVEAAGGSVLVDVDQQRSVVRATCPWRPSDA